MWGGDKYAELTFKVLDDFIDEARESGFSEYVFKKRLAFLKTNFLQINQFRIYRIQIINYISKKPSWMDTAVFFIKKCGFKPSGQYNKDIYLKIVEGKEITEEDVLRVLPRLLDYLVDTEKAVFRL